MEGFVNFNNQWHLAVTPLTNSHLGLHTLISRPHFNLWLNMGKLVEFDKWGESDCTWHQSNVSLGAASRNTSKIEVNENQRENFALFEVLKSKWHNDSGGYDPLVSALDITARVPQSNIFVATIFNCFIIIFTATQGQVVHWRLHWFQLQFLDHKAALKETCCTKSFLKSHHDKLNWQFLKDNFLLHVNHCYSLMNFCIAMRQSVKSAIIFKRIHDWKIIW